MIRNQTRLRICWMLLIMNLCFIWGNSLLPGEISGRLSDWVKEILLTLLPGGVPGEGGGGLLRKLAHFTEFACLGALLSWLTGMLRQHPALALICGMAVACVDETIQRFVPDRGPSLRDVGIDTCGVIVGMTLLLTGHHLLKRRKTNLSFGGKQS